jgi:hypothetical protein
MAFKSYRFPLTGGTCNQQWGIRVRSTTKVSFDIVFPKTIGRSYFASWNLTELITERIDTISGFWLGTSIPMVPSARDWRNYPYAEGREAKGYIIFQVFYLGNPNTRGRHNLVQCNRGSYGCSNFIYLYLVIGKGFYYFILLFINSSLLTEVSDRFIWLKQADRRELK